MPKAVRFNDYGGTERRRVEARARPLAEGATGGVAGAGGGVGSMGVRWAGLAGGRVIGLASEPHHAWLTGHGVIPVSYGEGVAGRIREAAASVDAFIDTVGGDYVRL